MVYTLYKTFSGSLKKFTNRFNLLYFLAQNNAFCVFMDIASIPFFSGLNIIRAQAVWADTVNSGTFERKIA